MEEDNKCSSYKNSNYHKNESVNDSRIRKDIITSNPFVSITSERDKKTKEIIISRKELTAMKTIVKSDSNFPKYYMDSVLFKNLHDKNLIGLSRCSRYILVNEVLEEVILNGNIRGSLITKTDDGDTLNVYWGNFCA